MEIELEYWSKWDPNTQDDSKDPVYEYVAWLKNRIDPDGINWRIYIGFKDTLTVEFSDGFEEQATEMWLKWGE